MAKEFKKQTSKKDRIKERALQELKKAVKIKGTEHVLKNFPDIDEKSLGQTLNGKKTVPETWFLSISEITGCTYDYLTGDVNKRDKVKSESKKHREKVEETRAQQELKRIYDERGELFVATELGISPKAATNIVYCNHATSRKHYPKIAELTGCTLDYLYYRSDFRNDEELAEKRKQIEDEIEKHKEKKKQLDDEISGLYDELGKLTLKKDLLQVVNVIQDSGIDALNKLALNIGSSINEIDTDIIPFDENYADVVSFMISRTDLWLTMIDEAKTLVDIKTNMEQRTKFEYTHNRNAETGYDKPIKYTPDDYTIIRVLKVFKEEFIEYVKQKIATRGLTEVDFYQREQEELNDMLKYKNNKNN